MAILAAGDGARLPVPQLDLLIAPTAANANSKNEDKMRFVWVGMAGAVGSVARYAVGLAFSDARFPWGTLMVNIVGSLALGFVFSWGLERWPVSVSTPIAVGLIGGFTTFSTFAFESVSMVGNDQAPHATVYVLASVLGGLLAASLGYAIGRSLAD